MAFVSPPMTRLLVGIFRMKFGMKQHPLRERCYPTFEIRWGGRTPADIANCVQLPASD